MIAGAVKYFRFPIEYILYELSYVNLVMLSATIPDYGGGDKSGKAGGGGASFGINDDVTLRASDPEKRHILDHLFGKPTVIKKTQQEKWQSNQQA